MENPYIVLYIILLGLGVFYLILRYLILEIHSKKDMFRRPINYVEIRGWRKKSHLMTNLKDSIK